MIKLEKDKKSTLELLRRNAEYLVQSGKGILAADESPNSVAKWFDSINVENTAENRRIYRQLLFTSPDIEKYISGAIMHEETFDQGSDSSEQFPDLLISAGILPGIKLDKGLESITSKTNETTTLGFDDLEKRCEYFYSRGAKFAKWRCVLCMETNKPTELAIWNNAIVLARFATICQSKGLVPIVEPEVLSDGKHTLERCQQVTETVLAATFKALSDYDVYLEGCLLKPNMVTFGQISKKQGEVDVALATITALSRTVPPALPGIVFLDGGQSEDNATLHLNEMNKSKYAHKRPWKLTFSYGRALQVSALNAWGGNRDNETSAQQTFLRRAAANAKASTGEYEESTGR